MKLLLSALTLIALAIVALAAYAAYFAYPSDPGRIVMGTGGAGGAYDELARRYKADLARYGVDLQLKPDLEGFYVLKATVLDANADAGFVKGGFVGGLEGRLATPDDRDYHAKDEAALMSLGRVLREPIWVFVRKDSAIAALQDLKGKTVLIGDKASGVRKISGHLLKAAGVEAPGATLLEEELSEDAAPLREGRAAAAFLVLPPQSPKIQTLLRNPDLKLLDFSAVADAYANRFAYLSKIVLHQGAVELNPVTPNADATLLSTEAALVVRRDMNPTAAALLAHAMLDNPAPSADANGDPVLFYRSGEYPRFDDAEFDLAPAAATATGNRELPFIMRELGPLNARLGLPFALTAFASEHGSQLALLLLPLLTVLLPAVRILPMLYSWSEKRKLQYWYRRLKSLETRLAYAHDERTAERTRQELETIDTAVTHMRVPLAFANQLYDLRLHINLVRQRLAEAPAA